MLVFMFSDELSRVVFSKYFYLRRMRDSTYMFATRIYLMFSGARIMNLCEITR